MIHRHGWTAFICLALVALAVFVGQSQAGSASTSESRASETWAADLLIAVRADPILSGELTPRPGVVFDPGEAERWLWRWTRIRAASEADACRAASASMATLWRATGNLIGDDGTITGRLNPADVELWQEMDLAAGTASREVDGCLEEARRSSGG